MYISFIVNIRSSLIYLNGFYLLVLLPQLLEITFIVCINRITFPNLKIYRLVIISKGLLKLPNLHMLIKQKSLICLRNIAAKTLVGLLIVPSTKVNLLYLLNSFYEVTFSEVVLNLCKSTIQLSMVEYCCHICPGTPSYYLKMLGKLPKHIYRTLVLHLLPLLVHY